MKLYLSAVTLMISCISLPLYSKSTTQSSQTSSADSALTNGVVLKSGDSELKWFDGKDLTILGKGFTDTPSTYSRLPTRAENKVPDLVWKLSKNPAGINIRFVSNMSKIKASWTNSSPMNHMAYSGSGGLDLYKKIGNRWEFAGVGVPGGVETTSSLTTFTSLDGQTHEYMLYLPLYSDVQYVKLGINKEAFIAPSPKSDDKPIVFYGTSITQGGCASRAGMSHSSILGRWLHKDVVNLGFSASGCSEPEVAEFISEIDASMYVIEPLANMGKDSINERSLNFCNIIRKKHPNTPIVLVLAPVYTEKYTSPSQLGNVDKTLYENNIAFTKIYETLISNGDKNVYLQKNSDHYMADENPTVDGVHPTDLGFYLMAKDYEPLLKQILENKSK